MQRQAVGAGHQRQPSRFDLEGHLTGERGDDGGLQLHRRPRAGDLGDDTCLVVYATDCDPRTMALVIGGGTAGALVELKRLMENPATGQVETDHEGGEH